MIKFSLSSGWRGYQIIIYYCFLLVHFISYIITLMIISDFYFMRHITRLAVSYCYDQVGEPYRLDVFVAERFKCDSSLLLQTSGVLFFRQWETTPPRDYITEIGENAHLGELVQVKQD